MEGLAEIGAFRRVQLNLETSEDRVEPVVVTEITAGAFQVARVSPLYGRALVTDDERTGAANVLVIGFDVWRDRFGADPQLVGQSVRLGNEMHTVVGVMPQGFTYPVAENYWIPLRLRSSAFGPGTVPDVRVVGRLAPDVDLGEAQAELTAVGLDLPSRPPEASAGLSPELLPYGQSIIRIAPNARWMLRSINVPLLLLMLLVSGNVALLMFARAASREGEIVVRTALGASRSRIVRQLVAEALVLGFAGAGLGILVTERAMRWALETVRADLMAGRDYPFWFNQGISPSTLAYTALIVVVGSVVMGVLPALKMTGKGVERRLKRSTAGGGLSFGGVWTAIIVAQVAVTVTFPVATYFVNRDAAQIRGLTVPFPANEYLVTSVGLPPVDSDAGEESPAEFAARFAGVLDDIADRLSAEANVVGVTMAERMPLQHHEGRVVALEAGPVGPFTSAEGYFISSVAVDVGLFADLAVDLLAGRSFGPGDAVADGSAVIVNQSFVDNVLGGRNALGHRLRYVPEEERRRDDEERWFEIVGVVPDLAMAAEGNPRVAGVYHPGALGSIHPVQLAIRVAGPPSDFESRLREIAAATHPQLQLTEVMPLSDARRVQLRTYGFWFRATIVVSGLALVLALAGIYAVMSFTVSRKTREIGIRVALGSTPGRIIARAFARPAKQVLLGLGVGAVLAGTLASMILLDAMWPDGVIVLLAYSAVMGAVCATACVVPIRRALSVEPVEALRAEA